MSFDTYLGYLLISFVVIAVPGPNVTLILASSAMRGWRTGLVITSGVAAAMVLQVTLVSFGLVWLVQTFSEVFDLIRYAGAAYLVYLGIQTWRSASEPQPEHPQNLKMLRKGFWVGLANPKSLTFFAAFFPQFINPELPSAPQFALLAASFIILAFAVNSCYSIAAGFGHQYFVAGRARQWLGRASGLLLVGGAGLLVGVRRD